MSKRRYGSPRLPIESADGGSVLRFPPCARATPVRKKTQEPAVIVNLKQYTQKALQAVTHRAANLLRCERDRARPGITMGRLPTYEPRRTEAGGKGHLKLVSDRAGYEQNDTRSAHPSLPSEQLEALCLIAVENLSLTEAAAALGIDLGTLKSRLEGLPGAFYPTPYPPS